MQTSTFPETAAPNRMHADRLGIAASVLCAIHCAAAPILLIFMPVFGEIWAHPASHWGMALFVIPIAAIMTIRGFQKHQRKWVLGSAAIGIIFVTVGAFLPYLEIGKNPTNALSIPISIPWASTEVAESCADTCCPSTTKSAGKTSLNIPPAAIITTLGGIALIITHFGNLCACRSCQPHHPRTSK